MEIIIHRGTKEIGGTCVELIINKKRLLLDIGLPLDYDSWSDEQRQKYENKMSSIIQKADAIFLSHYHQDHTGLLNLVPERTPIYLSDPTIRAIRIPEMFFGDVFKGFNFIPIYHRKEINEIDGVRITPYRVDHSAFGAMAFLIEDLESKKSLLYTGDIRLHGLSKNSYLSLKKNTDYLLLEGTNIGRESKETIKSEHEVFDNFVDIFNSYPTNINYVWASSLNIDRINVLYDACMKTNKILVVDFYTMNILKSMYK
ncbi:MAG: MBL fold metallo-hydrolase, partial [Bacteroidales bacterium]|nr:MBL fold metallo-hydrolase [Bacteroidales bacterium]